ncbi:MAG: hypothetical protein A2664_02445 [Candidatus Taylorbacteria bacterium RIFCSPHIGHO2_01_FULL_46_22b]|uniref:Uncharacterized protein n=1 Tax=Candidatus Taylorbacteria bacterium RIFCSPHIGHO2_01_FULL_46_22b TaxID=1802301 RepID=A0A1G2M339_9BACT|nr:MAG: hypothetical protein A2664_02445 [Candidatus Taylorbacteria bacterium RIFCSPHIGHO2_01_FULL_46_22b]
MTYSPTHYAAALLDLLLSKKEGHEKLIAKFAALLVKNRHAGKLRDIMNEFERLWYKHQEITPVTVVSATKNAVHPKDIEKLVGTKIALIEKIDENVKGGVRISVGDWRIDNTLSRRFSDMKGTISK